MESNFNPSQRRQDDLSEFSFVELSPRVDRDPLPVDLEKAHKTYMTQQPKQISATHLAPKNPSVLPVEVFIRAAAKKSPKPPTPPPSTLDKV